MTELQSCEFELLKVFVDICQRLGLKYYLICGSALGAVKYKGFIPWDDDIDVGMPRADYEVFLEEAPKHLPGKIRLQNSSTENYFPMIFTKLRNITTTYIESGVSGLDITHGVFIDIFPLDFYPNDKAEIIELEKLKSVYRRELKIAFSKGRGIKQKICGVLNTLLRCDVNVNKTAIKLNKYLSKTGDPKSGLLCNHGNWQGKMEYAPCNQYGDGVTVRFEGLSVTVPERYDEYLTQKYGDWRADLPEDKKEGHHYYEVCDLERPYTDYTVRLGRGRIRIKNKEDI